MIRHTSAAAFLALTLTVVVVGGIARAQEPPSEAASELAPETETASEPDVQLQQVPGPDGEFDDLGDTAADQTDDFATQQATTVNANDFDVEEYAFREVQGIDSDDGGAWRIVARVTNTGPPREFVGFTASLLDADGTAVGTTLVNVEDFSARATVTVEGVGNDGPLPDFDRIVWQVDLETPDDAPATNPPTSGGTTDPAETSTPSGPTKGGTAGRIITPSRIDAGAGGTARCNVALGA